MLKALIDLFRFKSEEKKPEVEPQPAPKEHAEVKEPIAEIKPTVVEITPMQSPAPESITPISHWSPVPEPVLNIVIDTPIDIKIAPPVEPTPIEAAFIAEPVAVKDEVVVEVEKKPKRGRPKSGSKPKNNKKK